jgi:hypothetical protein
MDTITLLLTLLVFLDLPSRPSRKRAIIHVDDTGMNHRSESKRPLSAPHFLPCVGNFQDHLEIVRA